MFEKYYETEPKTDESINPTIKVAEVMLNKILEKAEENAEANTEENTEENTKADEHTQVDIGEQLREQIHSLLTLLHINNKFIKFVRGKNIQYLNIKRTAWTDGRKSSRTQKKKKGLTSVSLRLRNQGLSPASSRAIFNSKSNNSSRTETLRRRRIP